MASVMLYWGGVVEFEIIVIDAAALVKSRNGWSMKYHPIQIESSAFGLDVISFAKVAHSTNHEILCLSSWDVNLGLGLTSEERQEQPLP